MHGQQNIKKCFRQYLCPSSGV